ncbi:MAG: sulfite exporter TauE/SafE family protein [Litorivicinus sp.]
MDVSLIAAGAIVGGLVGATGLGAAALMTPLLALGFGVPLAIAVSTDLVYAAVTKAVAATRYAHQGHTQWRWVGWMAAGSLPAAMMTGVWIAPAIQDQTLGWMIGAILLVMALSPSWGRTGSDSASPVKLLLSGVVIGTLVSLTSVGAGVLGTIALLCFASIRGSAALVGTELTHALALSAVASLTHLGLGRVDFELLLPLLLGGVPAAYLGARLGPQVPLNWIKHIARALIALAAIKMMAG